MRQKLKLYLCKPLSILYAIRYFIKAILFVFIKCECKKIKSFSLPLRKVKSNFKLVLLKEYESVKNCINQYIIIKRFSDT